MKKKRKLTYENAKKRLKNIRRRIFYRLQTSADTKKHQKTKKNTKNRQLTQAFNSKIIKFKKNLINILKKKIL